MSQRTAIALLSGGLDSATAAALAQEEGDRVIVRGLQQVRPGLPVQAKALPGAEPGA